MLQIIKGVSVILYNLRGMGTIIADSKPPSPDKNLNSRTSISS